MGSSGIGARSKDCQKAFQQTKRCLMSSLVLVHFNPKLNVVLATDASAYGLGAVLSHQMPNGEERPIAFASRTMSPAECNYSQLEKEALSIIFGIKKFHQYLFGRQFTLLTDHKPLVTILGPKSCIPTLAAARLQRWAILLSAYSFHIGFRGTKDHANADALSRLPLKSVSTNHGTDVVTRFNLVQMSGLPLTHSTLRSSSRRDSVVSKVIHYTLHGWPNSVPENLKVFWRRRHELTSEAGCLLWGCRVVVPAGACQRRVMEELHKGHPGIVRMKALARSYIWWPGMDQEIERWARACSPCTQVKSDPAPVALHPWVWPTKPWRRIHIDFAGPLFNKTYLVIVDAFSKWPEVWEMGVTSTTKTIEVLQHLFSKYGIPEQVVSDNRPQFRSEEFEEFVSTLGIKYYRSAVYHPATNGAVERLVKTLKQSLKAAHLTGASSKGVLNDFLFHYRATPHAVTGVTPGELFLGRSIRTLLDLLKPNTRNEVERNQAKQKEYHDQRRNSPLSVKKGDQVLVRVYREGLVRWKQGVVTAVTGDRTVKVMLQSGTEVTRHFDQIQRCPDEVPLTTEASAVEQETPVTGTESNSIENDAVSGALEDSSPSGEKAVSFETGAAETSASAPIPLPLEVPCSPPEVNSPAVKPPVPSARRFPSRVRRPPERPWFVQDF